MLTPEILIGTAAGTVLATLMALALAKVFTNTVDDRGDECADGDRPFVPTAFPDLTRASVTVPDDCAGDIISVPGAFLDNLPHGVGDKS